MEQITDEVKVAENGVPIDFEHHKETHYAPYINHGEHRHRLQLRNDKGELVDAPAYDREFAEQKYAALLSEFCIKDEDDNPESDYSCIQITLEPVN